MIEHLTQVKGIGVWTAQMFLMFALRRHGCSAGGGLGIRSAMKKAYGLDDLPKPAEMEKIAAAWKPYSSSRVLVFVAKPGKLIHCDLLVFWNCKPWT